jgi:hypothetical protein
MRIGWIAGWIVAALVVWPLVVSAGVPTIDKDERALRKYAVDGTGGAWFLAKARGLCVCVNHGSSEYEDKVGILEFERVVETIAAMHVRDMLEVHCRVYGYHRSTGSRDVSSERHQVAADPTAERIAIAPRVPLNHSADRWHLLPRQDADPGCFTEQSCQPLRHRRHVVGPRHQERDRSRVRRDVD